MNRLIFPAFQKKSNALYSVLLRYVTVSIVVTCLAVSSIQYLTAKGSILNQASSAAADSMNGISYSSDLMTESSHNITSQLYLDFEISSLFNSHSPSSETIDQGLRRIMQLKASSPLVDSIYIYNGANDTFYTSISSHTVAKSSHFFDQEIVSFFKDPGSIRKNYPIPRSVVLPYKPSDNLLSSNVFSYIYFEPSPGGKSVDSAIIVNVSAQWLQGLLLSSDYIGSGTIIIFDKNGKSLIDTYNRRFIQDSSQEELFKALPENRKAPGYFIHHIDGVKSLVTYVPSKNLDWVFVRYADYNLFLREANAQLARTVYITLMILLAGILASYFLSRQAYKPVDQLVSQMKTQLIENRQELSQLKNRFLHKLLTEEDANILKSIKVKFEKLNIRLDPESPIMIILLRIDRYYSHFCAKYNDSDRGIMKFAISNIAEEILTARYCCETTTEFTDFVACLVNIPNPDEHEHHEDEVRKAIEEIQASVEKYLDISLTASVSPAILVEEGLKDTFHHAYNRSNLRLKLGHKAVIFPGAADESASQDQIFPVDRAKQLNDALMLGKTDSAKAIISEIVDAVPGCSSLIMNSTLLRLILVLSSAIESLESANGLSFFFDINSFYTRISHAETLIEIKHCFNEVVDTIAMKLDERKNSKHTELAKSIEDLIRNNFLDQNLCLESISDALGYSTVHISKLFKSQRGKSITDFLNEIRLEKAKELLKSSDISINDVSVRVGYSNSKYFYTLFKKHHGITPNDFRLKSGKEAATGQ